MYKVVIIGGGWSGCAAALSAKKAGAEVTLLEKTDLLLGLGNVGGIMRNNGRFTAAEENIALGAKELFGITDKCSRHVNIDFPGHKHASLYDVTKVEPNVRRLLREKGIDVRLISRGVDVVMSRGADESEAIIEKIVLAGGEEIEGDVFVETTGSTGPMGNCLTYGNGCCMCILRCPAFGPRVSISAKAGGSDIMGKRKDGAFGAFSGSGKLEKQSLSQEIQDMLNDTGVAVIPLPKKSVKNEKL
ncbi:MAG: FAD-dependent oxidoreductase, partial [Anaerovoracaceae bacterium]